MHQWDSESEVIAMANSLEYGLSASVWSKSRETAKRIGRRLEAGIVWVNTWEAYDRKSPFGGVKESGIGRENGLSGIDFFTEVKPIALSKL